MEEKKFVQFKKDELSIKEFVKKSVGKGKVSDINIEYTPIGEKIVIATSKPGFIIGRMGARIIELTETLKKRFKLENPRIEIKEITKPEFDAQLIADDIALLLERRGNLKFKVIAYRTLERIMKAGALGAEIRLGGKLPSARAKSWRFAAGYLKKTGDTAKVVNKAEAIALTQPGVIGIKVSILPPDAKIHDKIDVNEELKSKLNIEEEIIEEETGEEIKKVEKIKKKQLKGGVPKGDLDSHS